MKRMKPVKLMKKGLAQELFFMVFIGFMSFMHRS
jgi:hypothetical protein